MEEESAIDSEKEKQEAELESEKKELEADKKELREETEEAREITNLKKIEAALFIAGRWLSMQDLIMLTDVK